MMKQHSRPYTSDADQQLGQSSAFQHDVVKELRNLGLHPAEEVLMPSGYRLDDVLVEVGGQALGLRRTDQFTSLTKFQKVAQFSRGGRYSTLTGL